MTVSMNQMDTSLFDWIKSMAVEQRTKIDSPVALAPQNDPFHAGTPGDIEKAEWFVNLWNAAGYTSGVHLRRAHYWAVSKQIRLWNGDTYENTTKCWQDLTQAAKIARYLGVVPIEAIIDNKNPDPIINSYYWSDEHFSFKVDLPDDPFKPDITIFGPHPAQVQPYHLELFIEKGTMNDVLEPICKRFGANLNSFQGEASITSVYNLARRIEQAGKPTVIVYISDFDPAGKSMPVAVSRKLEYMLQRYGITEEVYVKALALTEDQVSQHRLPRVPIKVTEKRAGKFEEAYGEGATELDALEAIHPGVLARVVRDEFRLYYDQPAADGYNQMMQDLHRDVNARLAVIGEQYREQLEVAREALKAMSSLTFNTSEYEPEVADSYGFAGNEEDMLFSTERSYTDQLDYYRAHKGRE